MLDSAREVVCTYNCTSSKNSLEKRPYAGSKSRELLAENGPKSLLDSGTREPGSHAPTPEMKNDPQGVVVISAENA